MSKKGIMQADNGVYEGVDPAVRIRTKKMLIWMIIFRHSHAFCRTHISIHCEQYGGLLGTH